MTNIVFLISQPRAGSTATQLQLARHPDIHTLSEPWLLLPLLGMHKSGFMNAKYGHHLFLQTQRDYIQELGQRDYDEFLMEFVQKQYCKLASGKRYFLDKTPRYYEILPELYRVFPTAKFIILKRHPINVLKSIVETWCSDDLDRIIGYSRDILLAPKLIHSFLNKHGDESNVVQVRYEDFVSNSNLELSRLHQFLSLPDNANLDPVDPELLKGGFGDLKNARSQKSVVNFGSTWENPTEIQNTKLRRLAIDYSKYLGDEFLLNYGNYTVTLPSYLTRMSSVFRKLKRSI